MQIECTPCNPANYSAGRTQPITYLVLHYTANNGDTAQNNCDYFAREAVGASAHYFVDESNIKQSVADGNTAWHCGGGLQGSAGHAWYGVCTNSNSIGIEMCSDVVDGSYVITAQTVENAVALVQYLMATHNIPLENVIRHYDVTGKTCPAPWVQDESQWQNFKQQLEEETMTVEDFQALWYAMRQQLQDNDASAYSTDARQWALDTGLIVGDEHGMSMWEDVLTREQFITVLYRFALANGAA